MGKNIGFPSSTPYVRPKSAIYNPKRDDDHPRHFHMGVPPPPGSSAPEAQYRLQKAHSAHVMSATNMLVQVGSRKYLYKWFLFIINGP